MESHQNLENEIGELKPGVDKNQTTRAENMHEEEFSARLIT